MKGRPLRGLVLEAPVGRLQDLPGMVAAFGCVSKDPLQQRFKLGIATRSGTTVILVHGKDAASTRSS